MTTEPILERPTKASIQTIKYRKPREQTYRDYWELILFIVIGFIGASAALLGAPIPLRIAFGLPLIVFIPGYALTSALFPTNQGLDGLERIALGFGLSLAQIPLIALGIEFSPWRLTLGPIVGCLIISTLIFSAIGAIRRNQAEADERFVAQIPTPAISPASTWSGTTKIALAIIVG